MLKSIIVILPMVLGAFLAHASHAETTIVGTPFSSVSTVQADHVATSLEGPRLMSDGAASRSLTRSANFVAADVVGSASHLPEPAVWAMLLVGFGVTGGLLRRRRAAMIAA